MTPLRQALRPLLLPRLGSLGAVRSPAIAPATAATPVGGGRSNATRCMTLGFCDIWTRLTSKTVGSPNLRQLRKKRYRMCLRCGATEGRVARQHIQERTWRQAEEGIIATD